MGYDRVELLQYMERSAERMRDLASNNSRSIGQELLELADELAREADALEKDLIQGGHLPTAANER
jgi:hypothetical protein